MSRCDGTGFAGSEDDGTQDGWPAESGFGLPDFATHRRESLRNKLSKGGWKTTTIPKLVHR